MASSEGVWWWRHQEDLLSAGRKSVYQFILVLKVIVGFPIEVEASANGRHDFLKDLHALLSASAGYMFGYGCGDMDSMLRAKLSTEAPASDHVVMTSALIRALHTT